MRVSTNSTSWLQWLAGLVVVASLSVFAYLWNSYYEHVERHNDEIAGVKAKLAILTVAEAQDRAILLSIAKKIGAEVPLEVLLVPGELQVDGDGKEKAHGR